MKPKRRSKTFAGNMTRNLNRRQQIEGIKKQLLQKARKHQSQKAKLS
ncbi:MAG: hypothetical protein O7E52_12500 [Candidatus Poribacteria bacterium]|nr:hypothetical protein [Candidatus Poribacteria bacterium]